MKQRRLSDEDFGDFFSSSAKQDRKPPKGIDELRKEIISTNPFRWASLKIDLRWLKKEMRKRGMDPEDARWLL